MAVANTKGANITALDAGKHPPVRNFHARQYVQKDTLEVAAADDDTSVYRLFRVHSSWVIDGLFISSDAITSGSVFDIGIYETAENGGAVVSQEAYGSDVDLSSGVAGTLTTNHAYEARNIDKITNQVWQDAGLTADPNKMYDICLKGTTVGSAAGTISGLLKYTGPA